MKAPRGIIRAVSFLLFIVLALQLSGATCYGEELTIGNSNQLASHQIKQAIPDDHDTTNNSTGDIDDSFHCPCHGNFTQPPYVTLTSHLSMLSADTPSNHFFFKNVSTRFFQPPRTIL